MISIKDNVGFITGFGAGVVISYVIGKVVFGFAIPDRNTDDSDVESDGRLWN